jgi:CheY-like chemotaxis protein
MGGDVAVESELGKGSRFTFTVQLAAAAAGERRRPLEFKPLPEGLRVLVVDDNETNRKVLLGLLRRWRLRPDCVGSACEGESALRAGKRGGDPYRLVITDAMMPEVDGFTFVERISGDAELAGAPMMMLTSNDLHASLSRCQLLGISVCLIKPVMEDDLLSAISRTLAGAAGDEAAAGLPQGAPRGPDRKLRVLLAEDNHVNQRLAVRLLEKQGHEVVVAQNGLEALRHYQEAQPEFDLVLMDVQMPEMDGLEATRTIRSLEHYGERHLPIVGMTAHVMKGDRERCLAAGMDGYVAKPVELEQLWEELRRVMGTGPVINGR